MWYRFYRGVVSVLTDNKLPDTIITELFLVKADWTRTFLGEIRRETDNNGNPVVLGVVILNEVKIWNKASTQEELMKNMDDICILKLDYGTQRKNGIFTRTLTDVSAI